MKRTNTLFILVAVFGLGMVISTVVHMGSHSSPADQLALQQPAQVLPVNR